MLGWTLDKILENRTTKNIAISLGMAAFGFAGHQLLVSVSDTNRLDEATHSIQKLWEAQKTNADQMTQININLAQINGKLDVINQKIDDDRLAANRGH